MVVKRIICILIVGVAFLSGLSAFQVLQSYSFSKPGGADASVVVRDWKNESDSLQVRTKLASIAAANDLTIAKVVFDLSDNRNTRHLYVAKGEALPSLAEFAPRTKTVVHDFDELSLETAKGHWALWGEPENIRQFSRQVVETGIDFYVVSWASFPRLTDLRPEIHSVLVSIFLLMVAAGVSYVVLSQRRLAIQAVCGASFAQKVNYLVAPVLLSAIGSAIVVGLLEFSYCAKSGAQKYFFDFLSQTFTVYGIMLAGFFVAVLISSLIYHLMQVLPAIKGDSPGKTLLFSSYVIRVVVLLLVLAVTPKVLLSAQRLTAYDRYQEFIGNSNLTYLQMANAFTNETQDELGRKLTPWLIQLDKSGDVVLSQRTEVVVGEQKRTLMLVNAQYFSAAQLETEFPKAYSDTLTVFYPNDLSPALVREQVSKETEYRVVTPPGAEQARLIEYQPGKTAYSLQMPSEVGPAPKDPKVSDPIMVVVPAGWFKSYFVALSQKQVYLRGSAELVTKLKEDPKLWEYVQALTPAQTLLGTIRSGVALELQSLVFSLGLALLTLAVATFNGVATFVQSRSKMLRVKYVFGARLSYLYQLVFLLELGVIAVISGYFSWGFFSQRQEVLKYAAIGGGMEDEIPQINLTQFSPLILAAGTSILVAGMCLVWIHHRFVKVDKTP